MRRPKARSKSGAVVASAVVAIMAVAVGYLFLLGPRRVMRELEALRQDFVDFYRNFFIESSEDDG